MGGKQKQAQRTKNNTRPSSSSRSAEKLGANLPVFIGLSANQDGGYNTVLPGFSSNDSIDKIIDPNIQLIFRKMTKKDPITKLKAMNEFISLINISDESVIISILSLWPRLYTQFSLDSNHRVREATQIAHGVIVYKCGRSIAPYLKQMIPVWLIAQYDIYPPAKLQSKEAFEKVFPKTKVPEVLMFCCNEILAYISDNLFLHTPTTIHNSKLYLPEECEMIYERNIITSLQAYDFFINNLPLEKLQWLSEYQGNILNNDKFWEFEKHSCSLIRSSSYSVIGSSAQRMTDWFSPKFGKTACNLIFNKLEGGDSETVISILENSILLMAYIPNWNNYIDIKINFLPHIYNVLSDGGKNNSIRVGPLLLPLLKCLSKVNLNDIEFFERFFEAISNGLKHRNLVLSKMGYESWLVGLVECFEYIANVNINEENAQSIKLTILSKAIRSWLTTIISPKISYSSFDYVKLNISYVSKILLSWTKLLVYDKDNKDMFSQLVRIFWQNIHFIITTQINNMKLEENDIKNITDIHIVVLTNLKNNNSLKNKKKFNVTFNIEESGIDTSTKFIDDKENINIIKDCPVIQDFNLYLYKTVNDICGHYLNYAKINNVSSLILCPLYSLIREFDSKQLHEMMLHVLCNEDLSLSHLYDNYYFIWLRNDTMRSQIIVNLTFMMLNYLNYEEQRNILKSFDQLPLSVIKWCISLSISHPYYTYPAINDWLKSETVHLSLISFCKMIIKEGDKNYLELLKMCFIQTDNGSLVIGKTTCLEIVKIFIQSLGDFNCEHLNICAIFSAHLLSLHNIIVNDDYKLYEQLLLGLFTLDCNIQKIKHVLPQDTISEINSSWQDGLLYLPLNTLDDFIVNAAKIVHLKLTEKNDVSLQLNNVDILVELSFNVISSCFENLNDENIEVFYEIILRFLKNYSIKLNDYIDNIELLCITADIVKGRFIYVSNELFKLIETCIFKQNKILNEIELVQVLSWVLYSIKLTNKIVNYINGNILTNSGNKNVQDITVYNELKIIFSKILYNYVLIKILKCEYKMISWCKTLSLFYVPIEETIISTFKNMPNDNYKMIYENLEDKSLKHGIYWPTCLYICDHIIKSSNNMIANPDILGSVIHSLLNIEEFEGNNEIDPYDIFTHKLCRILQVLENERLIEKYDDTSVKVLGIFLIKFIKTIFAIKSLNVNFSINDLRNCFHSPSSFLVIVVDTFYSCRDLILSDIDLTNSSWSEIHFNISLLKYLVVCVDSFGWQLQSREWDFIIITLGSILQSINKSKANWQSFKVSSLGCAVLNLFISVNKFVSNIIIEGTRKEPTPTIVQLLDEWRDLVSSGMHNFVIEIFLKICVDCVTPNINLSSHNIHLINTFNVVMKDFDWKHFKEDKSEHSINDILKVCLDLMILPNHHILKFMANTVLKSITPILIEADKVEGQFKTNPNELNEASTSKCNNLSVHIMEPALAQLQGCIETVLAPYKIGEDYCILLPYTDSHSIALSYLLVWEILLDIAQESTAYLQHEYSEFFMKGEFVDKLLNVLFKLLPEELAELSTSTTSSTYFKNSPELLYNSSMTSQLISWLACRRLIRCLQGGWLGALVRNWWGSLPTRSSQYVEQIVRTYISPLLIAGQFSAVIKNQNNIPSIEMRIHTSVNEIDCIYVIEDLKMGLTLRLCHNHPLNKPIVISNGTPLNNMAWLSMYLSHQNGSVYQAIRMWANAVQKKVESTPVCYVCYCRLHPTTGQLPKMLCQTCKNKFHNICLYKWFSTSKKTTCPMCRYNFII